ncbi:MAG: hypothetical protein FJ299_14850 [Planctomycetes bacterium]|nr:hypothetical protein [Planctomycetota bacterium]
MGEVSEPQAIEIADAPRTRRARPPEPRGFARALVWLAPLAFLVPVVLGFGFVQQGPDWLFGWVFGGLFALIVGWVWVSVFWPARAERRCPRCREHALQRLDPHTAVGVVCAACGWRDETASGWLLAEEEAELEPIVLEERRRRALVRPPSVNEAQRSGPAGSPPP